MRCRHYPLVLLRCPDKIRFTLGLRQDYGRVRVRVRIGGRVIGRDRVGGRVIGRVRIGKKVGVRARRRGSEA